MFDVIPEINWLAVLLSTLALAVLGGLYFGALVPKQYVAVLGRQDLPAPEPDALTYGGPVACMLVVVLTDAVLMAALDVQTMGDALTFGALVGVGYLVSMTFNIAINPSFPRPLAYGLLNTPYFLGGSLVACAILQLMG
ncbi:DUF1761 domain-containing protein [Aeromicrobium chenweiae]|uniref:DUF1761 domain-containing protein n=1 Tax=Aeromicrobium chenweiae TaxID=2079793 RepID=A0A2S0WJ28_9ACTN|nr:DUF1761 domain-containing protein [Aeromicrobium chenweiae]AWB91292.1 DUF1761 domain-containing protein [Aeromicrobium chenweiae]TGN31809.1 DUF1761 domain-containing protein [Aeromicrobium chenweiae]